MRLKARPPPLFLAEFMIIDDVNIYKNKETARFHMPGHKGRPLGAFFDCALPYDVTELPETDDLYRPSKEGGIERSEKRAAEIFGADITIYSAGGATLALQAAIAAVRRKRSGVYLCSRDVHMSIVNALALCDIQPLWFYGVEDAKKAAEACENIAAVILTYENYYGVLGDIVAYRQIIPNAVFIIDNAHGSQLAFCDGGKAHPLRLGGDLVIDSPHKTLPAMTGCALLHSKGGYSAGELKDAMSIFGSTSPSYLLLQSLDKCISYCDEHRDAFALLCDRVKNARQRLRLLGYGVMDTEGGQSYDPTRLCVYVKNADEIFNRLRGDRVIPEFCDGTSIVFIPSIMNAAEDFERLIESASKLKPIPTEIEPVHIYTPTHEYTLHNALMSDSRILPIDQCENRIAARITAPYPPGIPLIMPGEVITAEAMQIMKKHNIKEDAVCSDGKENI